MAEKTEDLNLPIAAVTRIIKDVLPDGVTISKEARVAITRAASVFVLYATSTANGFAQKFKRKTLTANDVIEAMKDLEFDEFAEPLQRALQSFKDAKSKKAAPTSKSKNLASLREEDIILDDDDEEEEVAKDSAAAADSSDLAGDRTSSPVSEHSSDSNRS